MKKVRPRLKTCDPKPVCLPPGQVPNSLSYVHTVAVCNEHVVNHNDICVKSNNSCKPYVYGSVHHLDS